MSFQKPFDAAGHGPAQPEPTATGSLTCFPFRVGDPPSGPAGAGAPAAAPCAAHEGLIDGVRRLRIADAAAWQALRLEALERHPEAFGASFEEEAALAPEAWVSRLRSAVVLGAERHGELVGCAGLFFEGMRKKRHKAVLWGVYVRSAARGAGIGRALVERVIEVARGRVSQLHTAVVCDNDPARRLYRELGFVRYGVEPRAIEVEGRYLDEELLVLHLDRRPAVVEEDGR